MLNQKEILSTIEMIDQQHLDIRTITMGISLLSCCDPDPKRACDKIYDKITRYAEKLVKTGEDIEREFGIPIVNKRISVTPMALVAGASETEDYVPFAHAMDRAAAACGVNFIGGYSALVQKGMTLADEKLIRSILSTPVWLVKRPRRLPAKSLLYSGSATRSIPSTTCLPDCTNVPCFAAFVPMQPATNTMQNNNTKTFLNIISSPLALLYHYTIKRSIYMKFVISNHLARVDFLVK